MSRRLTVGELFAGIGGFGLGLERTGGFEVKWQVENDEYCNRVLAKHWPNVRRYEDVREVHGVASHSDKRGLQVARPELETDRVGQLAQDRTPEGCPSCLPPVDLICGGFPCQPFSVAGKQRGKEDDRHLWPEMARVISDIRPTWVVAENVVGLIRLGLDQVLSDLEGMGYSAETYCLGAVSVDAPHRRMRVWIVGHRSCNGLEELHGEDKFKESRERGALGQLVKTGEDVAHADEQGPQGRYERGERAGECTPWQGGEADAGIWLPEPNVGRVAHGVPSRVDRLRCLGNAVVPQVVTELGNAILRVEGIL